MITTTKRSFVLEMAERDVEITDGNVRHRDRMPYVPSYRPPFEQMEFLINLLVEHADWIYEKQLVDEGLFEAHLGIAMRRTMEMFGR